MLDRDLIREKFRALHPVLNERARRPWAAAVARLLRSQADSPRSNAQRCTGPDHPDRDRQFVNIRKWVDIVKEFEVDPIV